MNDMVDSLLPEDQLLILKLRLAFYECQSYEYIQKLKYNIEDLKCRVESEYLRLNPKAHAVTIVEGEE